MTGFDKKRDELLATYYAIGTDVVVMPAEVAGALDRLELAEAKARFELERMDDTSIFRAIAEINRLRAALEKIAYTPAFKSQAEIEAFAEQVIISSREALAGDSDAI